MHKKFLATALILLAAAAGLAATAYGQHSGHGFGHRGFGHDGGGMIKHMAKQLNLTEAQQTQIKTIMTAERAKTKPLMQQLRQNQQAQNTNMNGAFDEAQARAFANKQAQIMSDLTVEKLRTKSQIYAVLTPEQQQKAQQLMQERKQRRQEHMKKHSAEPQPTPAT